MSDPSCKVRSDGVWHFPKCSLVFWIPAYVGQVVIKNDFLCNGFLLLRVVCVPWLLRGKWHVTFYPPFVFGGTCPLLSPIRESPLRGFSFYPPKSCFLGRRRTTIFISSLSSLSFWTQWRSFFSIAFSPTNFRQHFWWACRLARSTSPSQSDDRLVWAGAPRLGVQKC